MEVRRFTKKDVANKLKAMRDRAGLTQGEVAEKMGRAQQTIASWETGNSLPNIIFLFQLCDLYGIDINAAFDLNPAVRKEEEDLRFVNDTWDELSESAKQRLSESPQEKVPETLMIQQFPGLFVCFTFVLSFTYFHLISRYFKKVLSNLLSAFGHEKAPRCRGATLKCRTCLSGY